MKKTMMIESTHCHSCKVLIEDVCLDLPGILSCDVNVETGETVLEHDDTLNLEELVKEIESLGTYKVRV